ncbi:MAG: AEC family transporter [Oscillospiraceae bacterium]|nr:AEC family transporter [Oscillospiraceae bacterium]
MDMTNTLNQMGVLFITLIIGYIAHKAGLLSPSSDRILTKVVINIALPCSCLNSVLSGRVTISPNEVLIFVGLALLVVAVPFFVFYYMPNIMGAPRSDHGLYRFMIVFGNCGFMGFPVIQTLFGASAGFYVALFLIPYNLLSYSLGIMLVSGSAVRSVRKLLLNAPFISSVVTVIIYAAGITTAPQVILSTVSSVGGVMSPLAMLVTGSTLAAVPLKEVFTEWRIYPVTFVRLIVCPVAVCLILGLFLKDSTMLGVLTAEAGMPIAVNATMFSLAYGGNETLASKSVFISTLLSIATIPLIALLLL